MSSPSANSKLNYKHPLGPLFKIPIDLPPSPWVGHVPFMFVLFQALKPKSYVELGVHNGCSFLAAASAAARLVWRGQVLGRQPSRRRGLK